MVFMVEEDTDGRHHEWYSWGLGSKELREVSE